RYPGAHAPVAAGHRPHHRSLLPVGGGEAAAAVRCSRGRAAVQRRHAGGLPRAGQRSRTPARDDQPRRIHPDIPGRTRARVRAEPRQRRRGGLPVTEWLTRLDELPATLADTVVAFLLTHGMILALTVPLLVAGLVAMRHLWGW